VHVYKIEVLVIDFDGLGLKGVQEAIEDTHYPNRCISPKVKAVDIRQVEWSDEHPLNRRDTADAEYQRLFGTPTGRPAR
jgi:hypothetical protein